MTQKSLVYMVLAVAVGYLLVSTVPHQVSMYATPQEVYTLGEKSFDTETAPILSDGGGILETDDAPSGLSTNEIQRGIEETSFLETSRLPELMKWWTLDAIIAFTIYWVARRRLV